MSPSQASNISPDERVVFFPTVGRRDHASGMWWLPIHGWVFQPEEDSLRRNAALAILHRLLRLKSHDENPELLDRRLRAFLVDNQGGKAIVVRIGQTDYRLAPSSENGHFQDVLKLSDEAVAAASAHAPLADRWVSFAAVLPADDPRQAGGAVNLLPDEGLSIVSDIDDTIKVTHVGRRRKVLRQTFVRPFEAVGGMAQLYARWQAIGAAFHYVSRSPWQLYEPLSEFAAEAGFPRGAFHLRHFRWREGHTLRANADRDLKQRIIHEMIDAFPRRNFVLVGDSGERDPEVYGAIARLFPAQTRAVLIRNTTGEPSRGTRFTQAFDGLPPESWHVFEMPDEVPLNLAT